MNSKQRMRAALQGGAPDRVPVAPCYLNLYLEKVMGRYYLEQYRRRMGAETRLAIDHAEDVQFRANALYQALGVFEEDFDWRSLLFGPSKRWARNHYIEREGEHYYFVSAGSGQRVPFEQSLEMVLSPQAGDEEGFGVHQSADEGQDVWDSSAGLRSIADVDAAMPITECDELTSRGVFEVARQIAKDYAERYFLYVHAQTPFSSVYDVVGFAGCMTMIHDRPDLLQRILERKLVEVVERLRGYAGAGAHGVWVIEALAGADLISPRQYADFAFPYAQALIKEIKALGLAAILYFCGDSLPRLDMVRKLGVDAVALEESKKTFRIEIEEIVQRIGDITCVFGNTDAIGILSRGTPAEIERDVQRQIAAGKRRARVRGRHREPPAA